MTKLNGTLQNISDKNQNSLVLQSGFLLLPLQTYVVICSEINMDIIKIKLKLLNNKTKILEQTNYNNKERKI